MVHLQNVLFCMGGLVMIATICTATPLLAFRRLLEELDNEQDFARREGDHRCYDSSGQVSVNACPHGSHTCRFGGGGNPDRNNHIWCCRDGCSSDDNCPGAPGGCYYIAGNDCPDHYHCCPNGGHGDSRCGGAGCCSDCAFSFLGFNDC